MISILPLADGVRKWGEWIKLRCEPLCLPAGLSPEPLIEFGKLVTLIGLAIRSSTLVYRTAFIVVIRRPQANLTGG